MDHGGIDTFITNGSSDTTTAMQLDTWLTSLQVSTGADTINVIVEVCRSGRFIDGAQEIAKPGRAVIASTSSSQNAYASTQGAHFSDGLFTALRESRDLCTSFQAGQAAVAPTVLWQTPWLDGNGNGVPNENAHCKVACNRGLAAFFAERPPTIDSVTVPASITGRSGMINARVRDDVSVASV
jgi:hypothetical protein